MYWASKNLCITIAKFWVSEEKAFCSAFTNFWTHKTAGSFWTSAVHMNETSGEGQMESNVRFNSPKNSALFLFSRRLETKATCFSGSMFLWSSSGCIPSNSCGVFLKVLKVYLTITTYTMRHALKNLMFCAKQLSWNKASYYSFWHLFQQQILTLQVFRVAPPLDYCNLFYLLNSGSQLIPLNHPVSQMWCLSQKNSKYCSSEFLLY